MALLEDDTEDESEADSGISIEGALVEAVRIATGDGTLQHDLYEWDVVGDGVIWAKLGRTFPVGMQADGMI
jgi:hypothetical protein